jgi:hypothetical protein
MRDDHALWDDLGSITPSSDDDAQLTLWTLYELHYRGFEDAADDLEWDPRLLRIRRELEIAFESELRARYAPPEVTDPFSESFFRYVEQHDGPSLAALVQRDLDRRQVLDLICSRSVYHLKESDPTAWLVPRLEAEVKAPLMQLLFDEYGCGNPSRLHARLFADGMADAGLDPTYGTYVDDVPTEFLAMNNAMSLFGLHRRLRGAALGHLAAFETTSSLPSRRIAQGLKRLELPESLVHYYEEHVAADSVHEQVAVRVVCEALLAREPHLVDDVFFGAFTCLDLEDRVAHRVLKQESVPA